MSKQLVTSHIPFCIQNFQRKLNLILGCNDFLTRFFVQPSVPGVCSVDLWFHPFCTIGLIQYGRGPGAVVIAT